MILVDLGFLTTMLILSQRSGSTTPKANIDGKWDHDLHHSKVQRASPLSRNASTSQVERGNRLYSSIQRQSAPKEAVEPVSARIASRPQMSIKGMAHTGPYVVIASNFAPGTTAADIEAAMTPVGGEVTSCHLISAKPTVMAEIVFVNKEGAENVIATFNNQKVSSDCEGVCLQS